MICMYMILNCQVSENEMVENPLMMLFGELERRDPQHPAVLQFKSFMLGAKKTLQSFQNSRQGNRTHQKPKHWQRQPGQQQRQPANRWS